MASSGITVMEEFYLLNKQINELYRQIATKQGLSESAYAILQTVAMLGDGCSQTDIYHHNCLNKQTVNSSVKRLVQDGILHACPGKGREVQLYLTAEGTALVAEKITPYENAEKDVFTQMSLSDQRELIRLMQRYLDEYRNQVNQLLK